MSSPTPWVVPARTGKWGGVWWSGGNRIEGESILTLLPTGRAESDPTLHHHPEQGGWGGGASISHHQPN